MSTTEKSALDWYKGSAALTLVASGVALAIVYQDFSYVPEVVGYFQLLVALIVFMWMLAGSKSAPVRFMVFVSLAVLAAFAITAFVRVWNTQQQLADKSTKLSILDVINREPLLVAADKREIESCFERCAIVAEVSFAGDRTEWRGIDEIVKRYQEVAQDWQWVSMHAHIKFHRITKDHAAVEATTYIYKPGQDRKWYPALGEVWELHRGSDENWRIQAFYYGISPKDLDRYLQSDASSKEDQG